MINVRYSLSKIGAGLIWLSQWNYKEKNLSGDRDVERAWIFSHVGQGPGEALDFGCGNSNVGLVAMWRGYQVTALDLIVPKWCYKCPGVVFIHGDILSIDLPKSKYDLIINCSTIEHVGLKGRYSSIAYPDGDLRAMRKLHQMAKPQGTILMTIPVGLDAIFAPFHRVYGENRLPRLLDGYTIKKQEYWAKKNEGQWVQVERSEALALKPSEKYYGLGLFVLQIN